jgi:hypothetical protein
VLQPHAVDHGPALANRDRLRLRVADVELREHAQQGEIFAGERDRARREREVERVRVLRQRSAEPEHGHAVRRRGDQRLVRRQQLLVAVLVAAVLGQVEQVDHAARELGRDVARRARVRQGVRHALRPERLRVGHIGREVDEVRVVAHVIADQPADGAERGLPHLLSDRRVQPGQMLEQLA